MTRSTGPLELILGLAGAALTVALLVISQKLFAKRILDMDILGALALLAAAGQAVPLLGLGLVVRDVLVYLSHSEGPGPARKSRNGDNIGLVFLVAFGIAFLGVFALLYSSVFLPLVLLAVVARLFYRPLSRNTPRARATWRVMAFSSLGFGLICLVFTAHLS